jgi:protein-S-isoprenylcysteine O-methyltransferase Ste14
MALFASEEPVAVLTPQSPAARAGLLGLDHGRPTIVLWLNILWMVGILISLGFGLWSIGVLGLRRSFLYRRLDDPLIAHGPYAIVRHPQFLSAIGVTFFTVQLYITMSWWDYARTPTVDWRLTWGEVGMANWALFSLALWLLALLEDRELASHFGPEYQLYAHRVPRLFPN